MSEDVVKTNYIKVRNVRRETQQYVMTGLSLKRNKKKACDENREKLKQGEVTK
jgi:hypothetical protein